MEGEKRFDPQAEAAARIAWVAIWKPEPQRTLAGRRALDAILGTRAVEPELAIAVGK